MEINQSLISKIKQNIKFLYRTVEADFLCGSRLFLPFLTKSHFLTMSPLNHREYLGPKDSFPSQAAFWGPHSRGGWGQRQKQAEQQTYPPPLYTSYSHTHHSLSSRQVSKRGDQSSRSHPSLLFGKILGAGTLAADHASPFLRKACPRKLWRAHLSPLKQVQVLHI